MPPESNVRSHQPLFDLNALPQPISIGIGGPLSSLLSALSGYHPRLSFWVLCPLWGMMALLLVLLCPVLLPIYLLAMLQRYYRRQRQSIMAVPVQERAKDVHEENCTEDSAIEHLVDPKVLYDESKEQELELDACAHMGEYLAQLHLWESVRHHFGFLLAVLLGYYMTLVAVYFAVSNASYKAMQIYMEAARKNQVLQIATPEQLTYANHMTTIFTIAGVIIIFALVLCFALTFIRLLPYKKIAATCLLLVLKNLPGLALLTAIFYAMILLIERYYAHFRIIAVEAMIRGVDYFDPTLPFIILRLYVGAVLLMSFALSLSMGLHLLPASFRTSKSKDSGRYEPPPKSPLL